MGGEIIQSSITDSEASPWTEEDEATFEEYGVEYKVRLYSRALGRDVLPEEIQSQSITFEINEGLQPSISFTFELDLNINWSYTEFDVYITAYYKTGTYHFNALRNIDYYPEGLNPDLIKKELGELTNPESNKWNLVYKNATGGSEAIDCFCIPEQPIKFNIATSREILHTD